MKLLIPIDGSDYSLRAVEQVLRHVSPRNPPDIHLLHVCERIDAWEVRRFLTAEEIAKIQFHEGMAELQPCRDLLDAAAVPYHFQVLVGDGEVGKAISHYAAQHGCDLIVMGTHGRTGIGHLLMGSVASEVVHLTRVPVTLVK